MKKRNQLFVLALIAALFACNGCTKTEYINNYNIVSDYNLKKTIVQTNTTNVATGFQTVFEDMITDSSDQAVLCQAFIQAIRYLDDASGYFFVETYDAWMVAHATKPELIGTNRMDIQDENGKYYVRDMVSTVKYIGYGFIDYYFNNPSTNTIERKLSFVKSIPVAEFFVGSGFYSYDEHLFFTPYEADLSLIEWLTGSMASGIGGVFDEAIPDSMARVNFCRKMIDYIRFFDDQSGYFFIYDFNCVNVAHGIQKNLQGENLYDYQDSKGNYVIRGLVDVAKNEGSGYYQYYWNNPVNNSEEAKQAYVVRIPGTTYFIGSGIYLQ